MKISLEAWIIQDGNYPEFSVGDLRSFALEFYTESFSVSREGEPSYKHLENGSYEITAQVTFRKEGLTIINFGHCAYSEGNIDVEVGDWITGKFYIGIDPFMYFESWEMQPDVPKIKAKWRIDRIFLETTPRIEQKPNYFVRDESRFSEIEVTETNSWNDDEGNGAYRLECTELK